MLKAVKTTADFRVPSMLSPNIPVPQCCPLVTGVSPQLELHCLLCTGCFAAKGTKPVPGACDQDNFCVISALVVGQAFAPGCLGRLFPDMLITSLLVAREHTADTVRLNRLLVVNMLILEEQEFRKSSKDLRKRGTVLLHLWSVSYFTKVFPSIFLATTLVSMGSVNSRDLILFFSPFKKISYMSTLWGTSDTAWLSHQIQLWWWLL